MVIMIDDDGDDGDYGDDDDDADDDDTVSNRLLTMYACM